MSGFRGERSFRRSRSPVRNRGRSRSPLQSSSKRITISNIPYDMTWLKLKELVKEQVGYNGFVELIESNGKSVGMAVVEFNTPEVATIAANKLNHFRLGDRHLVVREESERDRERIAQYKSNVDSDDLVDLMNFMVPDIVERMGIEGSPTDTVSMANVDYSATWQELKDLFRLAGNVSKVDVSMDANGRSKGFATVKFSAPYEAAQAICMFNGQLFRGRALRLRFDRDGAVARRISRDKLPQIQAQAMQMLPFILRQLATGTTRSTKSLAQSVRQNIIPDGSSEVASGFGTTGIPLRCAHDVGLWIQEMMRDEPRGDRPPRRSRDMERHRPEESRRSERGRYVDERPIAPLPSNRELDNAAALKNMLTAAIRGGMREEDVVRVAATVGLMKPAPSNDLYPPREERYSSKSSRDHFDRVERVTPRHSLDRPPSPRVPRRGDRYSQGGYQDRGYPSRTVADGRSVIIDNLPLSYTESDVRNSFSAVGDVRGVELSRGVAIVHFYDAADAQLAVRIMNNVRLDGREVHVDMVR